MAYQSKYTGSQIDDILDSVEGKQNEIEDLASIRSGAAKGATALQSYTEKYTGTITGIKMNGASKGTSGVVDLGTVITAHQDISGKADKSSLAAVATSGSYNDLSNKPTIPAAVTESTVSGWGFTKNTGTVNGVKIDGTTKNPSSGVVDLGYINKQLSTSTSSSMTLSPNIYYRNTNTSLSTLTITLGSASNSNIINEYFVEFTTRSAGTTVSLPSTIKWANGETPTFEASTTYQISIVNNLGTVQKFK